MSNSRIDSAGLPKYLRELSRLDAAKAAERVERDAQTSRLDARSGEAVVHFLSSSWSASEKASLERIKRALALAPVAAPPNPAPVEGARMAGALRIEEQARPRERDIVVDELELLGMKVSGTEVSLWAQDAGHRPVFLGFDTEGWVQRKGGTRRPLRAEEIQQLLAVLSSRDAAESLEVSRDVLKFGLTIIRGHGG